MRPAPRSDGRVPGSNALVALAPRSVRLATVATALLTIGAAGCGDPVLPSDYAGPPAATRSADVVVLGAITPKEAGTPRLSLEWLSDLDGQPGQSTLIGQPLRFERSSKLQNDWDIGLELPIEIAKLNPPPGSSQALRFGVGKMVYYDDRTGDGRLNWGCRSFNCDQAKAVSREFVVYIEGGLKCRSAGAASSGSDVSARPSAGYNYYRWEGSSLSKLSASEPLNFVLSERSLAENDPSDDLRAFVRLLFTLWSLGHLSPDC